MVETREGWASRRRCCAATSTARPMGERASEIEVIAFTEACEAAVIAARAALVRASSRIDAPAGTCQCDRPSQQAPWPSPRLRELLSAGKAPPDVVGALPCVDGQSVTSSASTLR